MVSDLVPDSRFQSGVPALSSLGLDRDLEVVKLELILPYMILVSVLSKQ